MEPNIFRYIWTHTRREQIVIVLIIFISMIPYYMAFDLPKQIVNGPLQGTGFETPEATQLFLPLSVDLPFLGKVQIFGGIEMRRLPLLWALSLTFLVLVVVNNLFKYFINTRKGRLGERLLRRIRYELIDRILRFPPARARQMKAGEVSSMVKDEIEPLGGFAADAFTQPAMLGGQAVTAMFFIFVQHFWLGMVAAVMAGIQVAIIPRMRRRLILLGRERQLTARELAGRVAEIVDNIQTIHSSDTTNWERADVSARLGRIFRIRFDIYQWKFLVKFVNNFLAQVTPFLFYSIGGYLTIKGSLDVGQLIAVINAYKELPGPLKELIDWDLARQDLQVKYEQVVEQFESDALIDPARQAMDATVRGESFAPLAIRNLTVAPEPGQNLLEDVSLTVAAGEAVALTGGSGDGGPVLGEVLGGVMRPTRGRVLLGTADLAEMPEWVSGRMVGYVPTTPQILSGTVLGNLTYGLRRRPGSPPADEPAQQRAARDWNRRESQRAGNPDCDADVDWIDYDAILPRTGEGGLLVSVCEVLDAIDLSDDVIALSFRSRADEAQETVVADHILALRRALRERLRHSDLSNLVLPFEANRYNSEATVGENLMFGVPSDPGQSIARIVATPFFRRTLTEAGLTARLFDLGWRFARATLDLVAGMEDMSELPRSLTYMSAEDMPEFERTLDRTRPGGAAQAASEDRIRLIRLAFSYVEPSFRFGLLDDDLRAEIVRGRNVLAEGLPDDLRGLIQPYDPDAYLHSATLLENVLFGKINRRFGRAEERLQKVVRQILQEHFDGNPDLRHAIMSIGLARDVGPGGRHLSLLQRQKLSLARVLIRHSAVYVFNEPLAGVDPALQARLMGNVIAFLRAASPASGIVWIMADEQQARGFDRIEQFRRGHLVDADGDVPQTASGGG